ncbi:MAG: TfoX/Sxy family protein [Verrucomicrobiales bacterium]
MAYDEQLAARIGAYFDSKGVAFEAKAMMGGLCFMVDDKMCAGVARDLLMLRLDPDDCEAAMEKPGCRPMDFTGRPLKSFVFVEPEALRTNAALAGWLDQALAFNPKAKRSKPKARPKKQK